MTLTASNSDQKPSSDNINFHFTASELTSYLSDFSQNTMTGYWMLSFEAVEEHAPIEWYITLLQGNVIYSGLSVPTCENFIETLCQYSGLRKGIVRQALESLSSSPVKTQGKKLQQKIQDIVDAKLWQRSEIEQAFKISILNDFDRYLLHPGKGYATFTAMPELEQFSPVRGNNLNTILHESIRRRVQWTTYKPLIPSFGSLLTLPRKSRSGVSLQASQWKTLKGLIQSGHTIVEIAQALGKDSLLVAKSLSELIQQKMIVVSTAKDSCSTQADPSDQTPQVFIGDKSPHLARQLKHLTERWGYGAHACEDATSVVENVLNANPDVIFLDINMPIESGFDLIRQIRQQEELASVPVVLLTPENMVANQWRSQWSRCHFMPKPQSPEDISRFRVDVKTLLGNLVPLASDVLV